MAFSEYLQQSIGSCFRFKQLLGQGHNKNKQFLSDVFTVLFGENYGSRVCSGVSRKSASVADFLHVVTEIERKNLFVERVVRVEALDVSAGYVNDTLKANSGKDTSRPWRNCRDSLSFNEKFLCILGHGLRRLMSNPEREHHNVVFPKVNLSASRTYCQRVFVSLKKLKEICRVDVLRRHRLTKTDRSFNSDFFNAFWYREGF